MQQRAINNKYKIKQAKGQSAQKDDISIIDNVGLKLAKLISIKCKLLLSQDHLLLFHNWHVLHFI